MLALFGRRWEELINGLNELLVDMQDAVLLGMAYTKDLFHDSATIVYKSAKKVEVLHLQKSIKRFKSVWNRHKIVELHVHGYSFEV